MLPFMSAPSWLVLARTGHHAFGDADGPGEGCQAVGRDAGRARRERRRCDWLWVLTGKNGEKR